MTASQTDPASQRLTSPSTHLYYCHRIAVDHMILDLMRPLADHGITAVVFQKLLLELQTKNHTRRQIAYTQELLWQCKQPYPPLALPTFSSYSDRTGYDGKAMRATNLQRLQLAWFEECRPYYDLELKKRGGQELHVDVSYKVCI
jgi:hypothetical protein